MPIVYFILSILFFMPSVANAGPHENIQQLSFLTVNNDYHINGVRVYFHGRYQEDEKTFSSVAINSIGLLPSFFPTASECKTLEVHVYEIPRTVLNDRDVMSFLDWSSWNNQNILGTYDSIASNRGTASIFLTRDRGKNVFSDTIVHELVHFWQDSHCMPVIETPAIEFESYYKKRFN